jgi:hypothetical protein
VRAAANRTCISSRSFSPLLDEPTAEGLPGALLLLLSLPGATSGASRLARLLGLRSQPITGFPGSSGAGWISCWPAAALRLLPCAPSDTLRTPCEDSASDAVP